MSDFKISDSNIQIPLKEIKAQNFQSKDKLQKAAKEFESVFMDIVMKSMRNTVEKSDVYGDSEKVEFFQQMLDTEYSKISGQKNGIGLADAIVKQMSRGLGKAE